MITTLGICLISLVVGQSDAPTAPAFGETIERFMPFGVPCRARYIQFHTGNVFRVGDGPSDNSDHADEWKRIDASGGVDALLLGSQGAFQLMGEGCLFTSELEPDWDKTTADEVVKRLRRATWITGVIEGQRTDLPLTYLFKTAGGHSGILRIDEIAADERMPGQLGLKLRYKLVGMAPPDEEAAKDARAPEPGKFLVTK